MQKKKQILTLTILAALLAFSSSLFADCESVLSSNVGWTIIDSKTIEGWRDPGKKKEDGFEGCDYDRVIYFMDGTHTTCSSYGYQYAYMPTAIILGRSVKLKGKSFTLLKMIVEGDDYDLR